MAICAYPPCRVEVVPNPHKGGPTSKYCGRPHYIKHRTIRRRQARWSLFKPCHCAFDQCGRWMAVTHTNRIYCNDRCRDKARYYADLPKSRRRNVEKNTRWRLANPERFNAQQRRYHHNRKERERQMCECGRGPKTVMRAQVPMCPACAAMPATSEVIGKAGRPED